MKVLWVCNIMLPAFAKANSLPYTNREGWLSGSFDRIVRQRGELDTEQIVEEGSVDRASEAEEEIISDLTTDLAFALSGLDIKEPVDQPGDETRYIDLGVACPVPSALGNCRQEIKGVVFYGFQEDLLRPEIYDKSLETRFDEIIRDFEPDIVHIFGTEFPHTLAMTRVFHDPDHTLIGIQGLCRTIADTYMADLPYKVQRRRTFRDRVKKDSLRQQQKKFLARAKTERLAIKATGHVTGRTVLDRRETNSINPDALYHPMNETMRSNFYRGQWDIRKVEEHSIFISQGDYPLKGFHYMLLAMPIILMKYPDAKLYCSGNSIIGNEGNLYEEQGKAPLALRITSYGKYLKKLIRDYGLEGHVFMTGPLNADEMKQRFLDSHVFVCPSIMENSPNSLCEAMLLGMPVVAARVGGVPDLVRDEEEGLLFGGGRSDELASEVIRIFANPELACTLGKAARRTARVRHNADTNFKRLMEIYRSML